MTKRQKTNPSTYKVETLRGTYAVTLERLHNTEYGAPRFRAQVITLQVRGEEPPENYFFTTAWTFTGHYIQEREEAQWIVERYEEKLKEEGKE